MTQRNKRTQQIRTVPGYIKRDDGVYDSDRSAVVITDTATTECRGILDNRALRNADLCVETVMVDCATTAAGKITMQRAVDDVECRAGDYSATISTIGAVVVESAVNNVECP